jgi:hypothetical protein
LLLFKKLSDDGSVDDGEILVEISNHQAAMEVFVKGRDLSTDVSKLDGFADVGQEWFYIALQIRPRNLTMKILFK